MKKINGQQQIEALGNAAPDSMRWGDFIRMGRACDRFLRGRKLVRRGPYREHQRLKPSVVKEELE